MTWWPTDCGTDAQMLRRLDARLTENWCFCVCAFVIIFVFVFMFIFDLYLLFCVLYAFVAHSCSSARLTNIWPHMLRALPPTIDLTATFVEIPMMMKFWCGNWKLGEVGPQFQPTLFKNFRIYPLVWMSVRHWGSSGTFDRLTTNHALPLSMIYHQLGSKSGAWRLTRTLWSVYDCSKSMMFHCILDSLYWWHCLYWAQ